MYHPWDDDKGTRRRVLERTVVRGGLLPAGNDETDGLLRETRRERERKIQFAVQFVVVSDTRARSSLGDRRREDPSVPQEGRRGAGAEDP